MTQLWVGLRRAALLAMCVLVASAGAVAAKCGDNAGDAAAVAAVKEEVFAACGCTDYSTHARFVRCASKTVAAAVKDGSLPRSCVTSVMRCARQSTVGRPGAAICCTTGASGVTRSRVRLNPSRCTAPRNGSACLSDAVSACDACAAGACVLNTPTPTPSPTPTPVDFCATSITLPPLAQVPFTIEAGTSDCGGASLNPGPQPPLSGEVDDANGVKLADLGLGCMYVGALPPARIPDGGTAITNVVGVNGTSLVLGGSAGHGPADCTLPAGPGTHCLNGASGTDGSGACTADADCGGLPTSCGLDANCYFGPPMPMPNAALSACVLSTYLTSLCGNADLSGNATLSGTLSARVYVTGLPASPCPQCLNGQCTDGPNAGQACTAVGSNNTSADCPPNLGNYIASITVPLSALTTADSTLTATDGLFCPLGVAPTPTPGGAFCVPVPPVPQAFGISGAASIKESGASILTSGQTLEMRVGGTFCVPRTGSVLDKASPVAGPAAISAKGKLDLTQALPLLPLP